MRRRMYLIIHKKYEKSNKWKIDQFIFVILYKMRKTGMVNIYKTGRINKNKSQKIVKI